jgi:hypothetical protein
MDDTSTISLDISSTDTSNILGVAIWLNNQCVFQTPHVHEPIHYEHVISDEDGEHELQIVMSGKTQDHTIVDDHGNIVKDAVLSVAFRVDNVNFDELFQKQVVYTHNFNGTQPNIADTFHGFMGCNGTLSLKFTSPLFLWVLD